MTLRGLSVLLGVGLLLAIGMGILLNGGRREFRGYKDLPPPYAAARETVALTSLSPGANLPVTAASPLAGWFDDDPYQIAQGKRLFAWFNCTGCHFHGGGGSGPPLMDAKWIYGGTIENIVQTIREGRPNGMPSFRGRVPDEQIWQLAAYVRALGGNVSAGAATSRNDELSDHPAENRLAISPDRQPAPAGPPPP